MNDFYKRSSTNITGVLINSPVVHSDDRGSFTEVFRKDDLEKCGFDLDVMQVNCSVSGRGVIRGVHWADVPPGQAKYVTCVKGAVLDVIVDIRVGSPTFGEYMRVYLDDIDRRSVYVSAGLGHSFQAMTDVNIVSYLCSAVHNPLHEWGINPMSLGIRWMDIEPVLSEKDAHAPTLAEALDMGLLPSYEECIRGAAREFAGDGPDALAPR